MHPLARAWKYCLSEKEYSEILVENPVDQQRLAIHEIYFDTDSLRDRNLFYYLSTCEILKDNVREVAVWALSYYQEEYVARHLVRLALKDKCVEVRRMALRGLSPMTWNQADRERMCRIVRDNDEDAMCRLHAVGMLCVDGRYDVEYLLKFLQYPDTEIKLTALDYLNHVKLTEFGERMVDSVLYKHLTQETDMAVVRAIVCFGHEIKNRKPEEE